MTIKPLLSLLVSRMSLPFTCCRSSQHSKQVVGPPTPRHLTSNGSIARVITVSGSKTILPSLLGQDVRVMIAGFLEAQACYLCPYPFSQLCLGPTGPTGRAKSPWIQACWLLYVNVVDVLCQ